MRTAFLLARLGRGARLLLAALALACAPVTEVFADRATVAPASATPSLAARIDRFIAQPRFAHASWGIAVVSLDDGRMLYQHRPDRLLQTASTAKLFTAATVLAGPGASYRIPTRLLGGKIDAHGHLDGPLLLYGMGDPSLGAAGGTRHWADQLAQQLAARGVRSIRGDLIADDTYFSGPPYGSGWEAEDLQTWYGVPSSALSVDENIFELQIAPAARAGQLAELKSSPLALGPSWHNQLHTVPHREGSDIKLYQGSGDGPWYVFGHIALQRPPETFKLAIAEPAHEAGERLRLALARQGIRLHGQLAVRHWPEPSALSPARQILAQVLSPPVGTLLQEGLKRSQNLYLENLLQLSGVFANGRAGPITAHFISSAEQGLHAERRLLDQIGIDAASVNLSEGTGMSRRSLSTPRALTQLLTYLARQPNAAAFEADLPLAGVDGTLIGQLRHSRAAGQLHAKTGSMRFVQCLAGYVTDPQGRHLAFAIMLNNYAPPAGAPPASHEVDAVGGWLAGDGGAVF